MSASRFFSETYQQARNQFRDAALSRQAQLISYLHPLKGVHNETLAIDVALLGSSAATQVLFAMSGTHGAEGYCGSGAQIALFEHAGLRQQIAQGRLQLVQLHALNPHGFSFTRRVNEDNVDLNRNFVDFTQPLPINAGYAQLHPTLLPAQWPPTPENEAVLHAYAAQHGAMGLQTAISGGQYTFADGLFYGGRAMTWSNKTLRSLLTRLRHTSPNIQRLYWIDFHTGLGPTGYGEYIYAARNDAQELAFNRTVWGNKLTSFHDGSSTSAPLVGVNSQAIIGAFGHAQLACIALEYGIVPMDRVMFALRADHWLAKQESPDQALIQATRAAVRAAFYGETDAWKDDIVRQAHEAVDCVLQTSGQHPA
jgi:hypothetical protein